MEVSHGHEITYIYPDYLLSVYYPMFNVHEICKNVLQSIEYVSFYFISSIDKLNNQQHQDILF